MTACAFCGTSMPQPFQAQVQVRDHNGFMAAEYVACDPCALGLIKDLEFLAANKGTLRQVTMVQEDGSLTADVVS